MVQLKELQLEEGHQPEEVLLLLEGHQLPEEEELQLHLPREVRYRVACTQLSFNFESVHDRAVLGYYFSVNLFMQNEFHSHYREVWRFDKALELTVGQLFFILNCITYIMGNKFHKFFSFFYFLCIKFNVCGYQSSHTEYKRLFTGPECWKKYGILLSAKLKLNIKSQNIW